MERCEACQNCIARMSTSHQWDEKKDSSEDEKDIYDEDDNSIHDEEEKINKIEPRNMCKRCHKGRKCCFRNTDADAIKTAAIPAWNDEMFDVNNMQPNVSKYWLIDWLNLLFYLSYFTYIRH